MVPNNISLVFFKFSLPVDSTPMHLFRYDKPLSCNIEFQIINTHFPNTLTMNTIIWCGRNGVGENRFQNWMPLIKSSMPYCGRKRQTLIRRPLSELHFPSFYYVKTQGATGTRWSQTQSKHAQWAQASSTVPFSVLKRFGFIRKEKKEKKKDTQGKLLMTPETLEPFPRCSHSSWTI